MSTRLVGDDGVERRYAVPSSRLGVEHEIAIDVHTGEARCSCPDCVCRGKVGAFDRPDDGCKHIRRFWVDAGVRPCA